MTTPLHLKYFECIDDQFPPTVAEWSDSLPQKGHIYSVRRRYADDYPENSAAEAYLLWEIRSSGSGGKNQTYFAAHHFREVEKSEIGPILNLDQSAVDEICNRFIFRVDKLRRMYAGVASTLVGYADGIMEIEVRTHHRGYFEDKSNPGELFLNIPPSWKINPELKAATGYRMKLLLSKRTDEDEWETELINVVNGNVAE